MANFDIAAFRSQVKDGHMRNSNFLATLSLPKGLVLSGLSQDANFNDTIKKLQFYVESSSIPGISLATDEIRRYGHGNVTLRPYAPIFTEVDLIVRADSKGKIFDFFQTWMALVINTDTRKGVGGTVGILQAKTFEVNYRDDYSSEFVMTAYNDEQKDVITATMIGSYPIYLGPLIMDWSSGDQISKFNVKMTFNQWHQSRVINNSGSITATTS